MVVNGRPLKRVKRRVTADLFDFLTFPSSSSVAGCARGPFRTRVRSFLSKHALLPPPTSLFPHLLTWQISFRVGDATGGPDSPPAVVCLDVIEEDVARSRSLYCDQCRVVGWSGHPVCGKRYHFIIKSDGNSIGGYNRLCTCCGDLLLLSESRCKTCNHVTTTDGVEDWVYNQLENTTHLLHGVVHANGYSHLLRVNGREGGSRVLSGCSIMDFWDRLCKVLEVRKVSVMDVSKKYGLEYRLLHAVIKGHPWYGNWGYEFGTGSYAVTRDAYKAAVEVLSGLPLSIFFSESQSPQTLLQDVISRYQFLSERELVNIRDLFSFLMRLIHEAHKSSLRVDDDYKKRKICGSSIQCAWSRDQIERVEAAMTKVLRVVSGSNWVSWRSLKGVACQVASPDLLDFCLRELEGKQVAEGKVVTTRCNPETGTFEYRLEPGNVATKVEPPTLVVSSITSRPSEETLLWDLRYLYEVLLHPRTMLDSISKETRDLAMSSSEKLLDCKQFVKDYRSEEMFTPNQSAICLSCQMELDGQSEVNTNPPPEIIILPYSATVSDLKIEAAKAFQDVYLVFRTLVVEELLDYRGVDDSTLVKSLLGSAESVRVLGRCPVKNGLGQFSMERGIERWTVDCSCGAKDDDGERMLACDVCSVWQHTRCSGIPDSDSVPAKFICYKCKSGSPMAKTSGYCKEEAVGCDSTNDNFGLTAPFDVR